MKFKDQHYRAIWMENGKVYMIDQRLLPFEFKILATLNYRETCQAIRDMTLRGAGTIGAAAGFAMAQAFLQIRPQDENIEFLTRAKMEIENTRPTARDLFYAVEKVYREGMDTLQEMGITEAGKAACNTAQRIADQYVEHARRIGEHGKSLVMEGDNILTHCNAGWLALVDYGSALSPIYLAAEEGKHFHVWVDETRPRSQGARLTAWELYQARIPHTIIPDNAAAYLMSKGLVNMVITGADRIAANGDAANKIGTLEKAILAKEYGIPFYIAAPVSTFDKDCPDGNSILIEERGEEEVLYASGPDKKGELHEILTCNPGSPSFNPAFDVTPAAFITSYITELGIFRNTGEILNPLP